MEFVMTAVAEVPGMTFDRYLQSARETADPKALLDLVMAENERIKQTNVAWQQEWREATEVELDTNLNFRPKTLAQLQRLARMYADSGYVPDHYKGNIANTAIAVQMALRCHVDVMTFLQSSYIVYGKPGIEGKLVIAMLNCSGQIKGRVSFELSGTGRGRSCRAFAVDAKTGEELSQSVTWEMVEAEGWDKDKRGQKSKWITLPDLMFPYRAATFLARVHFPDVLMGMHTIEEIEDIQKISVGPSSLDELSDRLGLDPSAPSAENGHKPAKARGRRPAPPVEAPVAEKPAKAPSVEKTPEPEETEDEPFNPKEKPTEAKKPETEKPVEKTPVAASPRQNNPVISGIIGYMRGMFGTKIEGFNLEKIATDAKASNNWGTFCRSVIEKSRPSWETYVADEDLGPGEAMGQDGEISQESEPDSVDENQEAPDCVVNPHPRPARVDMVVEVMEREIMTKRQAKRIEDFATSKIKGNPELDGNEQAYLLSLCGRRAYYVKKFGFDDAPKERQIPSS
jgi:hypothetical protein